MPHSTFVPKSTTSPTLTARSPNSLYMNADPSRMTMSWMQSYATGPIDRWYVLVLARMGENANSPRVEAGLDTLVPPLVTAVSHRMVRLERPRRYPPPSGDGGPTGPQEVRTRREINVLLAIAHVHRLPLHRSEWTGSPQKELHASCSSRGTPDKLFGVQMRPSPTPPIDQTVTLLQERIRQPTTETRLGSEMPDRSYGPHIHMTRSNRYCAPLHPRRLLSP